MVVDTSALVACAFGEPLVDRLSIALERASQALLSAASLVECAMVLVGRQGPGGGDALDRLIERFEIELVPVSVRHAELARAAFTEYGKGRHRAALNFGDCFSYALAKERGEPLLFGGNDVSQTNVDPAPY